MKKSLVALCCACTLLLVGCGSDPEDVAEDYIDAVLDGDAEEVMDLTNPGYLAAFSDMGMSALPGAIELKAEMLRHKGEPPDMEVCSVRYIGNNMAFVTFLADRQIGLTLQLIRVDGDWKVNKEP